MATNDSPSADQMVGENAGALSRQLDERVNRLIESCCIGVDDVYYHDDSYAIHPQVLAAAIRLATSMVKEHGADASKVACALPMSSDDYTAITTQLRERHLVPGEVSYEDALVRTMVAAVLANIGSLLKAR
jgi:hypothetical protein